MATKILVPANPQNLENIRLRKSTWLLKGMQKEYSSINNRRNI